MNQIYSIDNIVADFNFDRKFIEKLLLSLEYMPCVSSWQSRKIGESRINLKIQVNSKDSFYIGVSPNWIRNGNNNVLRFDFNPNKVGSSDIFIKIFRDVLINSKLHTIKRFDVAIDFEEERANFFMLKDERKLTLIENSLSNKTEYLGRRSNHGRVKLYNKQLEAKLDNPRTRLELTMDYEITLQNRFKAFENVFPKIYCNCNHQITLEDLKVTGTDYVLLLAILDVPERIQILERAKKQKVLKLLEQFDLQIKPNVILFNEAFLSIQDYFKLSNYEYAA